MFATSILHDIVCSFFSFVAAEAKLADAELPLAQALDDALEEAEATATAAEAEEGETEEGAALLSDLSAARRDARAVARTVGELSFHTVTFYANLAHSLTRSP